MRLQIGDAAPDFEAETTEGPIASATGSTILGRSCSHIRRTSPQCAPPSSDTWPGSSQSSTAGA
jgi:hypothetical protein